jgi:hypothetical protein
MLLSYCRSAARGQREIVVFNPPRRHGFLNDVSFNPGNERPQVASRKTITVKGPTAHFGGSTLHLTTAVGLH